jgi:hypothetical protein
MKKQLECLFAWSEFYAANQRWEDYDKCQNQIEELKNILNN